MFTSAEMKAYRYRTREALAGTIPPPPKPSKYHNKRAVVDGFKFASKAEAAYYLTLKTRKAAGDLFWFARQVSFDLPGPMTYRADFVVCDCVGTHVVDVKSKFTAKLPVYLLKKKLMLATWGISITEIKAGAK